jgi:cobalt-zinc-cadmium efflux system outer membrane protein
MAYKNRKFFLFFLLFLPLLLLAQEKREFNLKEIIDIALKNNPMILAKKQEAEAKKAAFQASKRLFNPELEFHKGSGKLDESSKKINTQGLSITQSLENPLKRKYRIQMFEKEWQATDFLFDFAELETISTIKNLYYTILLFRERVELTGKNLSSIQEIQKLIEKRAKLGEVRELEAIKLKVESLKAQNEFNKIETELSLARQELNAFLGNSLPPDFRLQGKLQFSLLTMEENNLIQKALLSHPLIKGKEKELEQAQSGLNYTKWQRLPDPKLSGFIDDELDGLNKGVGISIELPLWNFKSREIAEAEHLVIKERQELQALKLELTTEIKKKLNRLKLSEQTINLFQSGLLKEAEASLKIAEVSYRQGEISLIDYLDSQRTYFSILKDFLDSLYDWNANKISLEKSIGEEIK